MLQSKTTLQSVRSLYRPQLPQLLSDLLHVSFEKGEVLKHGNEGDQLKALFPLTFGRSVVKAVSGRPRLVKPRRVGVVFSGGQAAGGHNVITGLYDALKTLHPESRLFGFIGGPGGIVSGNVFELDAELLKPFRNQGGFDLIGSGRTKIETDEQLAASVESMKKYQLDGLVIIGGDDSNTNAAVLAEYFLSRDCQTAVVGVPKTIDGDLKNAYVAASFGFDTACKVYAELIGNIARDALSAKKYTHFIKLMGRSASHIALECALAVQPNVTLISEEIAAEQKTLAQLTCEIADVICQRSALGKQYGVILIPEGLIEFIPEVGVLIAELNVLLAASQDLTLEVLMAQLTPESRGCFASLPEAIQKQMLLNRDPHGNVQVSLIETEQLLIETVSKELAKRAKEGTFKGKFNPQRHFFGYEGRAAFPSNFDATYCYALGNVAALLIDEGCTGYMCFVQGLERPSLEWEAGGLPITGLMHFEHRKGKLKPVIQKALVDLKGRPYQEFLKQRAAWGLEDLYLYPGPIQFEGDPQITDCVPHSILLG
jgi:pyrophosphate--fructose-6-phosphate 1-phosphotransferase